MRGDRGSATVEFAMTLPAVAIILAAVLGGARHAADAAVASHAASTAARVALVEGQAAGEAAGRAAAKGMRVTVSRDGSWWVARATLSVPGPLPDVTATARSYQP